MTHRQIIKQWLDGIHLGDVTVIDWGSGSKPASRYIHAAERTAFITVDNAPGIPDDRKGNAGHNDLDISQAIVNYFEPADVAFCLEVLEHVENPQQLVANIRNALKDGGKLYMSAPFKYEIHADADYWRFTANGLRLLLESHSFQIVSINETTDELGYMVEAVAV